MATTMNHQGGVPMQDQHGRQRMAFGNASNNRVLEAPKQEKKSAGFMETIFGKKKTKKTSKNPIYEKAVHAPQTASQASSRPSSYQKPTSRQMVAPTSRQQQLPMSRQQQKPMSRQQLPASRTLAPPPNASHVVAAPRPAAQPAPQPAQASAAKRILQAPPADPVLNTTPENFDDQMRLVDTVLLDGTTQRTAYVVARQLENMGFCKIVATKAPPIPEEEEEMVELELPNGTSQMVTKAKALAMGCIPAEEDQQMQLAEHVQQLMMPMTNNKSVLVPMMNNTMMLGGTQMISNMNMFGGPSMAIQQQHTMGQIEQIGPMEMVEGPPIDMSCIKGVAVSQTELMSGIQPASSSTTVMQMQSVPSTMQYFQSVPSTMMMMQSVPSTTQVVLQQPVMQQRFGTVQTILVQKVPQQQVVQVVQQQHEPMVEVIMPNGQMQVLPKSQAMQVARQVAMERSTNQDLGYFQSDAGDASQAQADGTLVEQNNYYEQGQQMYQQHYQQYDQQYEQQYEQQGQQYEQSQNQQYEQQQSYTYQQTEQFYGADQQYETYEDSGLPWGQDIGDM